MKNEKSSTIIDIPEDEKPIEPFNTEIFYDVEANILSLPPLIPKSLYQVNKCTMIIFYQIPLTFASVILAKILWDIFRSCLLEMNIVTTLTSIMVFEVTYKYLIDKLYYGNFACIKSTIQKTICVSILGCYHFVVIIAVITFLGIQPSFLYEAKCY